MQITFNASRTALDIKGHKTFYRVESPRGYFVAAFTTLAEAQACEVSERGKHWGGDCRICKMYC